MNWEIIERLFVMIQELIAMCTVEGRAQSEIRGELTSPSRRSLARLYLHMGRKHGIRGARRREYMSEAKKLHQEVTGAEIEDLIEDAKEAE